MLFRSSAAASEELSSQAALMKELLSRFKLRQDGYSYKPQASSAPVSSWSGDDDDSYVGSDSFSSAKY